MGKRLRAGAGASGEGVDMACAIVGGPGVGNGSSRVRADWRGMIAEWPGVVAGGRGVAVGRAGAMANTSGVGANMSRENVWRPAQCWNEPV